MRLTKEYEENLTVFGMTQDRTGLVVKPVGISKCEKERKILQPHYKH